ncbi:MAG: hypothetical protein JJE39_03905 [Vicinamibacteria bacterium]|nr:hypothetical protein [Vicinamibacteria bacterium]
MADRDQELADLTTLGGRIEVWGGEGGFYTQEQYKGIVAYGTGAHRRDRSGDRHARPHQRRACVLPRN